jgi:hypothetical protein
MTLRSKFWLECDPGRGECTAKSPERDTAEEARAAASEARWHVNYYGPFSGQAQCPQHVKPIDRVDWGSTA